jgi:hypothetical protein
MLNKEYFGHPFNVCNNFVSRKMQTHPAPMKRYCNLFIFIFFFLFLSNTAKYTSAVSVSGVSQLSIIPNQSNACSHTSMQEKKPHSEYVVILFRNGIEGKSVALSYKANVQSLDIGSSLTDVSLINPGKVKYILSFSDFLVLQPEFLSAFSFHAPPVLC